MVVGVECWLNEALFGAGHTEDLTQHHMPREEMLPYFLSARWGEGDA